MSDISIEQLFAKADDDVDIPYFVVRKKSAHSGSPAPALTHVYGGGNIAWLPTFLWQYQPFIEAGGVYIHPVLRGGGEYGNLWAAQGNRENKQRCFEDLYVMAEHAIKTGITTPQQLALSGESNGGMTSSAAMTQRPDLWAAVVPRFPVLDALEPFPFGLDVGAFAAFVPALYGDANEAEFAEIIASYSPYQNVKDGIQYPAIFLMLGLQDPLCMPSNGRRIVAKLQAAGSSVASDKPAIARFYDNTGHDFSDDESLAKQQIAEYLAFVMKNTQLEIK
nr:prolyl oligopeptidase family serine peptidase [Pseudomaricurvus alkylphenolicus]